MIDQQAYTSSIGAFSANDRTAGTMPGVKGGGTSAQTADATHFSQLVSAGLSCSNNSDGARTAGTMPVACDDSADTASADTASSGAASGTDAANNAGQGHGGFLDFILGLLDVINPLQHIPVISTIYRHLTGDEISPMAQVAGDTLYGGPIGAAVSMANLATKADTGHDIGDHVLAMVTGQKLDDKVQKYMAPGGIDGTGDVMVARNEKSAPAPQQLAASDIIWSTPAAQAMPDNSTAGAIGGATASPAHGRVLPAAVSTGTAMAAADDNIPTLSDAQLARLMSRTPAQVQAAQTAKTQRAVPQAVGTQVAGTQVAAAAPQSAFQKKYFHFAAHPSMVTAAQASVSSDARNTQQNSLFSASTKPQTYRTGEQGKGLASYSSSHAPSAPIVVNGLSTSAAASSAMTAAQAAGTGGEAATARPVDSTPADQTQDAPADTARTAVPPGLIASRMMEALDKYAAMNKTDLSHAGTLDGSYGGIPASSHGGMPAVPAAVAATALN